eukprot:TRINITY_DN35435_c0_g1_i1.p1 TRINITY_DN35435_c0_g1~~TRINITY_DN35435_c0_g1_i1.p1  ORF type:complete len:150 (-),score=39.49 TRINITY_DN35435_c0_g1_i1:375-824(-)
MALTVVSSADALSASSPRLSRPSISYSSAAGGKSGSCIFVGYSKVPCSRSALKLRRRRADERCNVKVRALFGLGVPELVVIAGVAALVFGPKKLPEIGKGLGRTVKSFQQAAKEFESEVKKENEPSTGDVAEPTSVKNTSEAKEENLQV